MSAVLAALQAQANAAVEESGIDLNEAVKGGGGGRLLPAGYAFGRIVEYIEFGNQPQEFHGKAKDPALEFTLGFALTGNAPNGETYHEADGTPYVVRTYNTALSRDDRSRAFKLFKALNWKGTAKGYAQLLGQPILVKIHHVPKSKTDPTLVSRIDLAGFLPPLDPVSQQPYAIPEAPDNLYRMFLWDKPTKEAWDSLFIEGTYDDGENKGKSRNRIQEAILGALDYNGSPLQLLLGGALALPVAASPQVVQPAAPVVPVAQAALPVSAPVVAAQIPLQPAPVVASLPVNTALPQESASSVTTSPSEVAQPVAAAPVLAAVPNLVTPAALPVLPV